MKTFSDMSLPLLFPDFRIKVKRFVYIKPFVKWIRYTCPVCSGDIIDLPLSDLEFKYAYPDVALEQGRISQIEYNKIIKYRFD